MHSQTLGKASLYCGDAAAEAQSRQTAGSARIICWGLICGFEVLLPYWYVCFFVPMIIHRAVRDDARCAEKYGADWDTYIKRVPYVFVPGLV